MKRIGSMLFTILALSLPGLAAESTAPHPWLRQIATPEQLAELHTIHAEADVEVSDGGGFNTVAVYHDPQRAAFRSREGERSRTMGVEGRYLWTFDGTAEKEGDPFVREFVLGHQFHAQILFYDRLHPGYGEPRRTTFDDRSCHVVSAGDDDSMRALYYDPAGRPLGMRVHHGPEMRITVRYGDWREVGGITLPFHIRIDDGESQFDYRYQKVRFNEGSLADLRAPLGLLTDEQALLRLHRIFMDDHYFGRSGGMKDALAESVVIVSRGEVHPLSGEETLQTLTEMLARTDYTVYDDLIRPVVRVSDDGTLGWVIVQVAAGGVQTDEEGKSARPLEFVSAWVELYEKLDGAWRMSGNVSNFHS